MAALQPHATDVVSRPWRIAIHTFTAFMLLSFGIKGIYFLVVDDAEFVNLRYPRGDELIPYIALAVLVSLVFTVLVWIFYRLVAHRLERRPSALPEILHPLADRALVVVTSVLLAWFLWERGEQLLDKMRTSTILLRNSMPSGEDYESGAYGVASFFFQIRNALFFALLSYSVLHRKVAIGAIATMYFVCAAAISDGSRFFMFASLTALPLTLYFGRWRRESHRKVTTVLVYVVLLVLPFAAAPLLVLRSRGEILFHTDVVKELLDAALHTFDGLDHLVNYIYLLPIDWGGTRTAEEFWQFIPRAVYHAKPSIYGMLRLQEIMYPHTVGGGGRYLLLGHYPLSCVVMAVDAAGPVGFVLHALGTGAMLAWIDSLLRRRTTLSVTVVVAYLTTSYHLVRAGFEAYALQSIGGFLIPFALFGAILHLARVRPGAQRQAMNAEPRAQPLGA